MPRFPVRAAAVAVALVFAGSALLADDTMLKVKEGDKFPDIALKAAQVEKIPGKKAGDTIKISELKGKVVVVFFYPRALTGGCTVESCGFRDEMKKEEFPKDVVILGASNDGEKLQQKFIDTNTLPYPLLCDTEFALIKELGIANNATKATAAKRVTFVVDKEGKIAKIYSKVTPASHPKEVIEFVKTLK
jgi:peroxiredoxin Q/BCP